MEHRKRSWIYLWPDWLKLLLIGFVVFAVFAFITTSATYNMELKLGRDVPYTHIYLNHLGKWLPWALLVPLLWFVINRVPMRRNQWTKPLVLHLVLSLLWAPVYLFLIIAFEVLRGGIGWATFVTEYKRYFGINILGDYQWYWVIFIAVMALRYARDLMAQRQETDALLIKNTQLQKSLAESQLQVLKAQIQPHFLYNTHHTIGALIREQEPDKALHVLNLLSKLLRRSLESDLQQQVTLGQELTFVEHYLEIQKMRFPERLRIQYEVDPASREAQIPAMILQPLVENAVHHGIVSEISGDTIKIHATVQALRLQVQILNKTGPESADSSGFGMGLKHTRSRLEHLYGADQSLELEYLDETTIAATLNLPYRK